MVYRNYQWNVDWQQSGTCSVCSEGFWQISKSLATQTSWEMIRYKLHRTRPSMEAAPPCGCYRMWQENKRENNLMILFTGKCFVPPYWPWHCPLLLLLSKVTFMTCLHLGGQVVPRVPGEAGGRPGWHSPVQVACAECDQRGALLPAVLLRSCGLRQEDGGRIHVSVCWWGVGWGRGVARKPSATTLTISTNYSLPVQKKQEVASPQQRPVGHGHHASRCRPLARRGNRRGSWVGLQSLQDPAGHPRTQPRHHQRPGGRSAQN